MTVDRVSTEVDARAVRALLIRTAGTNCDLETAHAFELAGAAVESVHVNALKRDASPITRAHILCFPGGFTYGDDTGAGRVLALEIRHALGDAIAGHCERGGLVLGICNGFQVLVQSGLLPDGPRSIRNGSRADASLTLAFNDSNRFEARWVTLAVAPGTPCVFLDGITKLELPVAHAEGRFLVDEAGTLDRLGEQGQLAVRYAPRWREETGPTPYPDDPNGSQQHVAGLCDPTGRIFGLMPHPERFVRHTQHPQWTRRLAKADDPKAQPPPGDGLALFQNAVRYCRENLFTKAPA